jgi:ATP-dependent helicase HrpB
VSPRAAPLPVEAVREETLAALESGRVVLTATTGSGKSTQVPRWCRARGKVLVVEPRRVACRSLARYVSELEGSDLGRVVGYVHRHDEARSNATEVLFVTPGVALRLVATGAVDEFSTIVLDEFHERSQELDLLLGLLKQRPEALVVMSATLDQKRLARFLEAPVVEAAGRLHPVEVCYLDEPMLPDSHRLAPRVREGVRRAREAEGDILVFLPGAREIHECLATCQGAFPELECLPLYGGLPGPEQDRAFRPGSRRRAIFATNVAETSITLPCIGVVVDSGLVRRTLYRWGAASLGLVPIARDSAEQRRGRAGRLGPGVCIRLWAEAGILEERTPPELHREPLDDLVLRAGECGVRLGELPMLDPPQPYALEHALEELHHLGAVDDAGDVTPRGRAMARHPLPPFLAGLLEEARAHGEEATLQDVVDLVASLAGGPWTLDAAQRRRLAEEHGVPLPVGSDPEAVLDDVTARVTALRRGAAAFGDAHPPPAFRESRQTARQFRRRLDLPEPGKDARVDAQAVARAALRAHPRMGFVRRARGKHVAYTNGGSELRPGRDTILPEDCQALVAFGVWAREGRRGTELLVTCAAPVRPALLVEAGLGRRRLAGVEKSGGTLEAVWETVYAGRVLRREEGTPRGELLADAAATLTARGKLFPSVRGALRERLATWSLHRRLEGEDPGEEEPEAWLRARFRELGVDAPDDLQLLEPEDLLPPELDAYTLGELDRLFPRSLRLPDGVYAVEYRVADQEVVLVPPKGVSKVPVSRDLPQWDGWRVCCRVRNRETRIRR